MLGVLAKVQTPAVARAVQPVARARVYHNLLREEDGNRRAVRVEWFVRGWISPAHVQCHVHWVWLIMSHYWSDSSTRKSETVIIAGWSPGTCPGASLKKEPVGARRQSCAHVCCFSRWAGFPRSLPPHLSSLQQLLLSQIPLCTISALQTCRALPLACITGQLWVPEDVAHSRVSNLQTNLVLRRKHC